MIFFKIHLLYTVVHQGADYSDDDADVDDDDRSGTSPTLYVHVDVYVTKVKGKLSFEKYYRLVEGSFEPGGENYWNKKSVMCKSPACPSEVNKC